MALLSVTPGQAIDIILVGVIFMQCLTIGSLVYSLRRLRGLNASWEETSTRQLNAIRKLNETVGLQASMLEQQNAANARQSAAIVRLRS